MHILGGDTTLNPKSRTSTLGTFGTTLNAKSRTRCSPLIQVRPSHSEDDLSHLANRSAHTFAEQSILNGTADLVPQRAVQHGQLPKKGTKIRRSRFIMATWRSQNSANCCTCGRRLTTTVRRFFTKFKIQNVVAMLEGTMVN